MLKKIKFGITEEEIANELEKFIKQEGAQLSFPPIVAFGKNSSIPHHQTGNTKIGPSTRFARSGREGLIILLDFGVKFENYCSDMTRTTFFGSPSIKQREIYQTVLVAQHEAIKFLNNQIKFGKKITGAMVDKIARNYIITPPSRILWAMV
ncbi:M24 family metallopeptidase [Candidatus Daviesbacteria bacterium]|nr:M24 family metallopeptidase [Candidatus Daviesbacteria bacterium]